MQRGLKGGFKEEGTRVLRLRDRVELTDRRGGCEIRILNREEVMEFPVG